MMNLYGLILDSPRIEYLTKPVNVSKLKLESDQNMEASLEILHSKKLEKPPNQL